VWNFQTLIISAVKICKWRLQTASTLASSPKTPYRGFSPGPHFGYSSPNENSWRRHWTYLNRGLGLIIYRPIYTVWWDALTVQIPIRYYIDDSLDTVIRLLTRIIEFTIIRQRVNTTYKNITQCLPLTNRTMLNQHINAEVSSTLRAYTNFNLTTGLFCDFNARWNLFNLCWMASFFKLEDVIKVQNISKSKMCLQSS